MRLSFFINYQRLVCLFFILMSPKVLCYIENRCFTSSSERSSIKSLCKGLGNIPQYQSRNIRAQEILCSSSSIKHDRHPQEFDFEKWIDLKSNDPWAAFRYRKALPDPGISWGHRLDYDTAETWTWESCDLVTDGLQCGYSEKCKVRDDGKKECENIPKTCYVDKLHYAHRFCSHEKMQVSASYEQVSENEWNPDSHDFCESIPNKYDLLPGEVEHIEIFNVKPSNSLTKYFLGESAYAKMISPHATVENARNLYSISYAGSGVHAVCKQNSDYEISVKILTKKRIASRSPNPLSLPKAWDGNVFDPIEWESSLLDNGTSIEKAYPLRLHLQDRSASAIRTLAAESRQETRKDSPNNNAFFKETRLRIRLIKEIYWGLATQEWSRIYVSENKGVKPSLLSYSDDQKVRLSDTWEITLDSDEIAQSLYRKEYSWFLRFLYAETFYRQHLEPNTQYVLAVSVHQPGISFYTSSCDDTPEDWQCRWWALGGKREGDWFSEELRLPFTTSSEYDPRSSWEKFHSFVTFRHSIDVWSYFLPITTFMAYQILLSNR